MYSRELSDLKKTIPDPEFGFGKICFSAFRIFSVCNFFRDSRESRMPSLALNEYNNKFAFKSVERYLELWKVKQIFVSCVLNKCSP